MLEQYTDILDVKELCEILHIERKTAYRLLKSGAIFHLRIGRNYKIPKETLIDFLKQN